jgi:hypothetical protein
MWLSSYGPDFAVARGDAAKKKSIFQNEEDGGFNRESAMTGQPLFVFESRELPEVGLKCWGCFLSQAAFRDADHWSNS